MNLFKNKKGFTLVEIIVVLLIIVILAAAALPTMVRYIDEAKGKADVAVARNVYIAAQMVTSEAYAANTLDTLYDGTAMEDGSDATADDAATGLYRVAEFAEVADITDITVTRDAGGHTVEQVSYDNGEFLITINRGGEVVIVPAP